MTVARENIVFLMILYGNNTTSRSLSLTNRHLFTFRNNDSQTKNNVHLKILLGHTLESFLNRQVTVLY